MLLGCMCKYTEMHVTDMCDTIMHVQEYLHL